MVVQTKRISIEEFDRFIMRPENINRNFELIAGEIVEKMVSNPRSSAIGALAVGFLAVFVQQHGLGRVTGADGGYVVGDEKYIPDAAYISKVRQEKQPTEAYNPLAPDLAIEVLSPSNDDDEMRIKIANYLAVGTVLWVIDPDRERVEVYVSGQPPIILSANDTLEGGKFLPGFKLAVKILFAE
jgi:Uma2 family endonuclease